MISLESYYKTLHENAKKYAHVTYEHPMLLNMINGGLDQVQDNLLNYQSDDLKKAYGGKLLSRCMPTGEINAISLIAPNKLGYLLLVDIGLGVMAAEAAKLISIVLALPNSWQDNVFVVKLKNMHLQAIEQYANTGSCQSNLHVLSDKLLFADCPEAFLSAGRIILYFYKFVLGHELSHVTEGHLDQYELTTRTHLHYDNVVRQRNEFKADVKSMEYIIESFPTQRMMSWDIYQEAMVAPYILLGIFCQVEQLRG